MNYFLKTFMAAAFLIVSANAGMAAEITVTGSEAEDVKAMGGETMKLVKAILPCLKEQMEQDSNTDKYKMYNVCICKNNNTEAISAFKVLEAIYNKNPKWSSYSSVKFQEKSGDMTTSSSLDIDELKRMIASVQSCLK